MTANSLTFFGALKGDSPELGDGMTRSFLAGLIARHLGRQLKLPEAEEAFICGMCPNLGESLVMFYFAAFDKLNSYAPIFGISTADSRFCRRVRAWLELKGLETEADRPRPAGGLRNRAVFLGQPAGTAAETAALQKSAIPPRKGWRATHNCI